MPFIIIIILIFLVLIIYRKIRYKTIQDCFDANLSFHIKDIACLILIDNFHVEIDLSSITLISWSPHKVMPKSLILSMIHANFIIQTSLSRAFLSFKVSLYILTWIYTHITHKILICLYLPSFQGTVVILETN